MIQHGVQRLPGNGDAKRVHAGEVRQAKPTRYVLLAEDHLLLGAMTRSPVTGCDAPGCAGCLDPDQGCAAAVL